MHLTSLQTSCFFPPNAQDKIFWLGTFGRFMDKYGHLKSRFH